MKRILNSLIILISVSSMSFAAGQQESSAAPEAAVMEVEALPEVSDSDLALAKGPNGETAVRASEIMLSEAQIQKVKDSKFKAALLWAGSGEWYNALSKGAEEEFARLGVKVVSNADAQFDPAKQATDVETCMALQPDAILTLVVDPVSGARAFRPVVDNDVVLVFADNGVDGYMAGNEYVNVVTGDHFGMGRAAAELMNDALNGEGKVGYIYHDADFFVTNNRDSAFKKDIENKYAGMSIASEKGFSEENATEEVTNAMMIQNPDINGIYVAWDVAAEGVVAALRSGGWDDVKVVTHDLGATLDLDIALDGNVYGKVADVPYDIGVTMARSAALELLGEDVPPFVVVPYLKMTSDNIREVWNQSLRKDPPSSVLKSLK
jgi:ribose transport system substrate-binding protein